MPKNGEEFVFSVADGSFEVAGWDQEFRKSASRQEHPARGEEHNDVPQGESDGSQLSDHQTDYIEARNDLWSISRNYIYRHHDQPRVKLYVPNEGSFPTPRKHIDVSGGQIRHWMYCWKVVQTIIGTSMVTEWASDRCQEQKRGHRAGTSSVSLGS